MIRRQKEMQRCGDANNMLRGKYANTSSVCGRKVCVEMQMQMKMEAAMAGLVGGGGGGDVSTINLLYKQGK